MLLRPIVKIHGGKSYLWKWIVDQFPFGYQHLVYLEPFLGGGSVLLNKSRSRHELGVEKNTGLYQIYRQLQNSLELFLEQLQQLSYSQQTFDYYQHEFVPKTDMDQAVQEYVIRRMSRGGMKQHFSWSERERGGQPGDVNSWLTMFPVLSKISSRLQGVQLINSSALTVLQNHEHMADLLVYNDPPYLPETRSSPQAYQDDDLTTDQHEQLLQQLLKMRGKMLISGYFSELYRDYLAGWRCLQREMPNHSGQTKQKQLRTEYLWLNF